MTTVLFVHGGGAEAHACDARIVDRLQAALGPEPSIAFPLLAGLESINWPAVETQLGDALRQLPLAAIVVAHSIGGAAVLKLLSEGRYPELAHLFLLAPPYNGADGDWGDSDFTFPAGFARHLPKNLPITLWHSEDDETIPVEHAHRYARKMKAAKVVIVHDYGHQFDGDLGFLARAIAGAAT